MCRHHQIDHDQIGISSSIAALEIRSIRAQRPLQPRFPAVSEIPMAYVKQTTRNLADIWVNIPGWQRLGNGYWTWHLFPKEESNKDLVFAS
jgi:hypothetical protein